MQTRRKEEVAGVGQKKEEAKRVGPKEIFLKRRGERGGGDGMEDRKGRRLVSAWNRWRMAYESGRTGGEG